MLKRHIANIVTLSRVLIIPLLIILFLQDRLYLMSILFSLAAFTDSVDGYLARYLHQTSPLGAWLDPLADKLIVISMLILLLADQTVDYLAFPIMIIICREVIISSLREWMATLDKHHVVKVSNLGKWKTFIQMVAILLFLLSKLYPERILVLKAAYYMLYLGALLTLISLIEYLRNALKAIQKTEN